MGRGTPYGSGGFRGYRRKEGRQHDFYRVTYRIYSVTVCPSLGRFSRASIENIGDQEKFIFIVWNFTGRGCLVFFLYKICY